jgi:hypothetical protein
MTADKTAALRALIDQVQPGWTVEHTNHDYITGSGRSTVLSLSDNLHGSGEAGYTAKLDRPVRNQGRTFTTTSLAWPKEDADFEVHGLTLKIFNPSHAYAGGRRALTHEFTYAPPEA